MNNLKLRIKKHFVNKKENTRKLKYESLLEENKKKNEEIINALYDRNKYMDLYNALMEQYTMLSQVNKSLREKLEWEENKISELLKELEDLRIKKGRKINDN